MRGERENTSVPGEPIRSAYIPDNIPKEFVVSDMPIYPLTRKILSLSGVVPVLAFNPLTSHQAACTQADGAPSGQRSQLYQSCPSHRAMSSPVTAVDKLNSQQSLQQPEEIRGILLSFRGLLFKIRPSPPHEDCALEGRINPFRGSRLACASN